jgi:ElaB/YqjD/DUF883 family membrane-anchored ribosome-binding protein
MTALPTPAENLAAAELRAQRARDQLHVTVAQLQSRLDPRPRAQKAAREARVAGETAAAIAKEQPRVTGGVAAGTALVIGLFFGRHRIARLFARPRPDTPPATVGLGPVTRTEP